MTAQRYYSNVYWHFTGSPTGTNWREVRRPADITKRGPVLDPATAKDTLKAILSSKKLLGRCTERVVDDLGNVCTTSGPRRNAG